jgi:metallo-beta-lactamase family protein
MAKKKNNIKVRFVGGNAEGVTGSMTLVETDNYKILLDCGLIQTNNIKNDYKFNSRKFGFKVSDIDYILISHFHADHAFLLPRLYREGCRAKIICTKDSSLFLKCMLKDSAFIMKRDSEFLNKKSDIKYCPLYYDEDVYNTLNYIEEHNFNELIQLNEEISLNFLPAYHIIRSAQIEIFIKQNNHSKKIYFSGDLGNVSITNKHFIEPFMACEKADLVIGECTYAGNTTTSTDKKRLKDIEKIEMVVKRSCIDKNSTVLIPCFSLDRSQNILALLYEIYGNRDNFNVPIYLDSPLAIEVTKLYYKVSEGKDKELLANILNWKNLKLIKESDDSKALMDTKGKKLVISASGMMDMGRSHNWAKVVLPDSNATILFVGYSSQATLASKIKNGHKQKTISIDNKSYPNRCDIVDLLSFSGHMQRDSLLEYYSNFQTEKIALVHSEFKNKIKFANDLQEMISKKNKTSKVIIVNNSTVINL